LNTNKFEIVCAIRKDEFVGDVAVYYGDTIGWENSPQIGSKLVGIISPCAEIDLRVDDTRLRSVDVHDNFLQIQNVVRRIDIVKAIRNDGMLNRQIDGML